VLLVGAGLPQLRGRMGEAKSYSEQLFDFPEIGPLNPEAATEAISKPALENRVTFDQEALREIVRKTEGYPYFLQEWGKHAWEIAQSSPIHKSDVDRATASVIAALDESFFLCVLIGSLHQRNDTCAPWPNWGPAPTAPAILRLS